MYPRPNLYCSTKNAKFDLSDFWLKIGNECLERIGNKMKTQSFKFVGIHLDENLDWSYHINNIHNKLSSANYAISTSEAP